MWCLDDIVGIFISKLTVSVRSVHTIRLINTDLIWSIYTSKVLQMYWNHFWHFTAVITYTIIQQCANQMMFVIWKMVCFIHIKMKVVELYSSSIYTQIILWSNISLILIAQFPWIFQIEEVIRKWISWSIKQESIWFLRRK